MSVDPWEAFRGYCLIESLLSSLLHKCRMFGAFPDQILSQCYVILTFFSGILGGNQNNNFSFLICRRCRLHTVRFALHYAVSLCLLHAEPKRTKANCVVSCHCAAGKVMMKKESSVSLVDSESRLI